MSSPHFRLNCGVWQQGAPIHLPPHPLTPDFNVMVELRPLYTANGTIGAGSSCYMLCLFPKGTDVRPLYGWNGSFYSQVEIPFGSQRWYHVVHVDDVAKGAVGEYRFAVIQQTFTFGSNPPYPIP